MKITYLLYDNMTLLDLVGPLQVWSTFPDVQPQLVARELQPVTTDSGLSVMPTHSFATAEDHPDIFFIPGGTSGTARAASDPETLEFVRRQGGGAQWVTSVCTGALVLGAAGLLQGYRAATHWAAMPMLENFGATPVDERYVIDRNRATGGGVTAGIDFGLAMMAEIAGEDLAKAAQLAFEYAPQPPFQSGTPAQADEKTIQMVMQMFEGSDELASLGLEQAGSSAA